jgi:hypothetical protein
MLIYNEKTDKLTYLVPFFIFKKKKKGFGHPWFPLCTILCFYVQIPDMRDLASSVSQRAEMRNEAACTRLSSDLQK